MSVASAALVALEFSRTKLAYGLVQNRAGKFLKPGASSLQAAAALADWSKAVGVDVVLTDAPGNDSYPIAASSFVLMEVDT